MLIKKIILKLEKHIQNMFPDYYFSTVWPYLNSQKKEKILEIVSEAKGVIPCEKYFWEKTEFYSNLKQSPVNDDDYENSKYLYRTLKMRHLGDLNDLYNV